MRKWTLGLIALSLAASMVVLSGCPAAVIVGAGAAAGGGYVMGKDKRAVGDQVNDTNLAASIKRELNNDPLVKDLGITVYSFKGHVYMVGIKKTDDQEAKAVATAKRFKETRSAEAFLVTVKEIDSATGFAKDSATTTEVKARLVGDKAIESTRIKVKTVRGHVVLLGIVENDTVVFKAKWQAEQVVGKDKVKSFLFVE